MFAAKVPNMAFGREVCWRKKEVPVMTSTPPLVISGF